MDISLLLKIAGAGMLTSVACQILNKSGREEQATLVGIAGIIIVLTVLMEQIGGLFETVRAVFGL